MNHVFVLSHDRARKNCADYILRDAPDGWMVKFTEPKRSLMQNAKEHALFHDICQSGKFVFMERDDWELEDVKRLLVDAFASAMLEQGTPLKQQGRVVPSLDGRSTVQLGVQTRKLSVKETANLIEFLYAYGSELGVMFKEAALLGKL